MKLKRLELVGFKSFAEKTRLDFEPGITAVVGPNGCGKSNIADAIRWALGEMSAKSLRSHQMLDVVFNGTSHRSPLGMAEVSLTFDNESHRLPLDYSEITVTRRLFRSGESEYFINKTQCRLKDIRDLFLDTGIGSDGYYVMEQGKVEFILMAKPEERRELFEEAAGVSKYMVRREEALRKLERVEQDMLRLNDSLAIYKQQMDSLDEAVRKARHYRKLQEDLRAQEIALLLRNLKQLETELATAKAEEAEAQARAAERTARRDREEAELLRRRVEAQEKDEQAFQAQQTVSTIETEITKIEARLQAAGERSRELAERQAHLEQALRTLEDGFADFQQSAEMARKELSDLEKIFALQSGALNDRKKEAETLTTTVEALEKALQKSRNELMEMARKKSLLQSETARLTSLLIRQEEEGNSRQREAERLDERVLAGRCALEEAQTQRTAHENTLTEVHRQYESAQAEAQDLQKEITKIQTTRRESENHLVRLQAELETRRLSNTRDPYAQGVEALRRNSLRGLWGPVQDLLRTSGPARRLVLAALGERAQCFVSETLQDAQEAIRFLAEGKKGRATFLILDRLPHIRWQPPLGVLQGEKPILSIVQCESRFEPVFHFLLGKTLYADATFFEEALLQGGSDLLEDSVLRTALQDTSPIEEECARLERRLSDLGREEQGCAKRSADITARIQEAQGRLQDVQIRAGVLEQACLKLEEDLALAEAEQRVLNQEIARLNEERSQNSEGLQRQQQILRDAEANEAALRRTMENQERELSERSQAMRQFQMGHADLRVQTETSRERLDAKRREHERLQKDIVQQQTQKASHQQEITEIVQRRSLLDRQQGEDRKRLETLFEDKRSKEAELLTAQAERQKSQEDLVHREKALFELRQSLSQAQDAYHEIELRVRMVEQERNRILQTFQETHQTTPDEAAPLYGGLDPRPEEVARLRRRLESMGPVNLAAPEEHAQLEERYQFLLAQQQDLLKAKEDLHQTIVKINATTREHFRSAFDQVRHNFRALYPRLFEGGEADLLLTDESDLLNTGVDIVAQPPGKKLQNIALLSGGEKALTAIALLFAFFMVKPSPFCLLDEVDAPLDEANVGRFLTLLGGFVAKTQFVLITHNKRTMEIANILYGITMAELGVSSVISVKLQREAVAVPA